MPSIAIVIFGFAFLILFMNIVALFFHIRKTRSPYGRRGRKTPKEETAAIIRDREVARRIDLEQERIEKYLKLRANTWALYEKVRQRHLNDSEQ